MFYSLLANMDLFVPVINVHYTIKHGEIFEIRDIQLFLVSADSVCLCCYVANGHIMTFSLPSLKPLLDEDYLPHTEERSVPWCLVNDTVEPLYKDHIWDWSELRGGPILGPVLLLVTF